jgi:hypothetical protein
MKNVYGLLNAMKTVENACEKGEITIIGEGKYPSPLVLLGKCVDYINGVYGCDVLAMLADKMKNEEPPCCCECCCECENEEHDTEDDHSVVVYDIPQITEYLTATLPKIFPYADEVTIDEMVIDIVGIYRNLDGEDIEFVDTDTADAVADYIEENLSGLRAEIVASAAEKISHEIHIKYFYLE